MKRSLLCMLLVFALCNAKAMSYQIVPPTLTGSNINAEELLNTYLVFQDNNAHEFSLNIEVYYSNEYTSSTLVLTMGTASILLHSNELISSNTASTQIISGMEFHHTDFSNYYITHGNFMSGAYHICYTFVELAEPQPEQECVDLSMPFPPTLHLISPINEAEIYTYNPLLNWIYTQDLLAGYQYQITIAEKDSAQTAEEAILNNPTLFSTILWDNNLLYPITAFPMEDCKQYAWKVDVINESMVILTSEIWFFSQNCPDTDTVTKPDYFYPLSLTDDDQIYPGGHYLPFMFDQPYQKITDFSIDIFNSDGNLLLSNAQICEVRTNLINKCFNGYNLFLLNLFKLGIVDEGMYILRFQNQKCNYYLRFALDE